MDWSGLGVDLEWTFGTGLIGDDEGSRGGRVDANLEVGKVAKSSASGIWGLGKKTSQKRRRKKD